MSNLNNVEARTSRHFAVDGSDLDFLLPDWLNDLLFAFERHRLLFRDFDVTVTNHGLTALARGEAVDESRHVLEHEVKAITCHGLKVEPVNGSWLRQFPLVTVESLWITMPIAQPAFS